MEVWEIIRNAKVEVMVALTKKLDSLIIPKNVKAKAIRVPLLWAIDVCLNL